MANHSGIGEPESGADSGNYGSNTFTFSKKYDTISNGNIIHDKDEWITVKNGAHVILGEGDKIKAGLGGEFTGMTLREAFGDNEGPDNGSESSVLEDPGKGESKKKSDPGKKQHHVAIKKTLTHVENEIRNLDHERAYVIDRDGKSVHKAEGIEDRVDINYPIKGLTVSHNHPSGSTLSQTDIFTFVDKEPYELRAKTPQGTAYCLRLKDNKADPKMKADFIKDKVVDIPTIDGIINERVKDGKYTSKYVQ